MNSDYWELTEQEYLEREDYYREVHNKETSEASREDYGCV